MRVAIFLCCCLSALLLAACAGPAADTGQVDNGSNPPVDALPGLPFEHAASVAVSTQIDGADYLLKSGSAAVDGTELELFSTLQDPSWGIWQLTPGNAELVNVQALLSIPAGSEAWVAVANYTSGRWEISGPTESSLTLPLNDAAHLSPSGNAHVAVIAAGADSLNVVRLVLATDRVGWQYTIYDDSALAGIEPQPLEVGGRPAIAYLKSLALDLTQIWFAYSSSVEGIDPGDWSHVLVYQADLATSLDAAIVNGNPAIVCQGRDPDRLLYIRSDTADGQLAADWPAPVEVASGAGVGWNAALSVNNGRPSIAYNNNDGGGIFYAHSNDPSGDAPEDWYVVRVIQADNGAFLDIADIAGNPAVIEAYLGIDHGGSTTGAIS